MAARKPKINKKQYKPAPHLRRVFLEIPMDIVKEIERIAIANDRRREDVLVNLLGEALIARGIKVSKTIMNDGQRALTGNGNRLLI